ncbi:MAG: hypothetical protein KDN22_26565 [Verrucomicrobiae bacterium]|nr:hypothetical protein [Verrucomicrobiae bacterium]
MRTNIRKTPRYCWVTTIATAVLLAAQAQESTTPAPPSSVEEQIPAEIDGEELVRTKMQIFRSYEGEWDGVQSYASTEANPAFESKGGWTGSYQLDGMYFELDGFSEFQSGKSLYRWMITYDIALKKYRAWTFNSNGIVTDWLAQYDPEKKELTWHFADPRSGLRGWLTTQALPNVVTGHGMAKAEGARVLSDYRLSYTRKKLRI